MSEQVPDCLPSFPSRDAQWESVAKNATSPTPKALARERIDNYRQSLYEELKPVGFTEIVIVNDLARRAAALDFLDEAIGAVQRESARGFIDLGLSTADDGADTADAVLVGAVSAGRLDECERRSLGNARAFFRALNVLREIQKARTKASVSTAYMDDKRFSTEIACEAYLRERVEQRGRPCRRCSQTGGHWLASRCCWECRSCKLQTGIRVNTVMERSPLPLVKWFGAIRALLLQPAITTAGLAERIDVRRLATVRAMATKIRAAMASDEVAELLFDLDSVYARDT